MRGKTTFLERPWVAASLMALILFSAATVPLETLPDLDASVRSFLRMAEIAVVGVFTAEYLYRLYTAERRLKFVFSAYGLIDLFAILPFFLMLTFDLRALRLLRLMRLLRLLKFVRYNQALNRMRLALLESKEELVVSLMMLCMAIYFAAFGIFYFEHAEQPGKFSSIIDAMWWAVATVTTVGYGDIYPITVGGRLFTFILLVASLGLVAAPTGIFASALLSIRSDERAAMKARADDGIPPA